MRRPGETCVRCRLPILLSEVIVNEQRPSGWGSPEWSFHAACWEAERRERAERKAGWSGPASGLPVTAEESLPVPPDLEADGPDEHPPCGCRTCRTADEGPDDPDDVPDEMDDPGYQRCRHGADLRECVTCEQDHADALEIRQQTDEAERQEEDEQEQDDDE